MKRSIVLTLLLVFSLVLGAASSAAQPGLPGSIPFDDTDARRLIREENPLDPAVTARINDFAYRTAAALMQGKTENINYSPLSLYFALSLSAAGAVGETARALLECLGAADAGRLAEENGNIFRRTCFDNEIGTLKMANSLWAAESFRNQPVSFQPDFLETARAQYYAHVEQVDFAEDDTAGKIAAWIREAAGGQLEPAIETDPLQVLSLINTIHFYDQWVDRFNDGKTKPDTFYLLDGSVITVDFLNRHDGTRSFQIGEQFSRAALPLKNGGDMVFILPHDDVQIGTVLMDEAVIKACFEAGDGYFGEVFWQIPKFDFDSSLDLRAVLSNLGLGSLFDDTADFSKMVDQPVVVSSIRQQSTVAIDEKGVSAAAFTDIQYSGAAMPSGSLHMILDRPFIYGIRNDLGQLLFIGVVFNPEPQVSGTTYPA